MPATAAAVPDARVGLLVATSADDLLGPPLGGVLQRDAKAVDDSLVDGHAKFIGVGGERRRGRKRRGDRRRHVVAEHRPVGRDAGVLGGVVLRYVWVGHGRFLQPGRRVAPGQRFSYREGCAHRPFPSTHRPVQRPEAATTSSSVEPGSRSVSGRDPGLPRGPSHRTGHADHASGSSGRRRSPCEVVRRRLSPAAIPAPAFVGLGR